MSIFYFLGVGAPRCSILCQFWLCEEARRRSVSTYAAILVLLLFVSLVKNQIMEEISRNISEKTTVKAGSIWLEKEKTAVHLDPSSMSSFLCCNEMSVLLYHRPVSSTGAHHCIICLLFKNFHLKVSLFWQCQSFLLPNHSH